MFNGNDLFFGLIVLSILIAISYAIYKSIKSEIDQGNKIVIYFMKQQMVVLFLFTMALTAAEAVLAAVFHPDGARNDIPVPVRVLVHMSVAFIGWLMFIQAGPKFVDFLEHILNRKTLINSGFKGVGANTINNKKASRLWIIGLIMNFATFAFVLVLGMGLPIANMFIVALGMEEHQQFGWFLREFILRQDLSEFYTQVPISTLGHTKIGPEVNNGFLPADYNPVLDMGYVLHIMMLTTSLNMLIALYKSFSLSVIYHELKTTGKNTNENKKPTKDNSESPDTKDFEELLSYVLVNIFEMTDNNKLNGTTTKAKASYSSPQMNASGRTSVVAALSSAKIAFENLDEGSDTFTDEVKKIKKDLVLVVNKSPYQGGLGLNLSSKTN